MKAFHVISLAVLTVVCVSCGPSRRAQQLPYAPQQVQQTMAPDEDVVTEWKKEGYKLTGAMSTFTMRSCLDAHNKKVLENPERFVPLEGTSEGNKMSDLTSASLVAQNAAAINYAQRAGSVIEGGIARQFSNLAQSPQVTKLMGAYVQKVAQLIIPNMKESFSIYKEEENEYIVRTFFILDEDLAAKAREKAMQQALKETEMEQEFGNSVKMFTSEFVK